MKVQNDVSVKVPIGKYLVTFIMTTCVVWFVIGIWSLSLDAQNPILIIEALMYIIPIGAIGFYFEFFRRPRTIVIADPLRMTYWFSGTRDIPLEDIEWVHASPGDPSTLIGRMSARGSIKVMGMRHFMRLGYEIAQDIRDLYRERLGRDPPHPPRRD